MAKSIKIQIIFLNYIIVNLYSSLAQSDSPEIGFCQAASNRKYRFIRQDEEGAKPIEDSKNSDFEFSISTGDWFPCTKEGSHIKFNKVKVGIQNVTNKKNQTLASSETPVDDVDFSKSTKLMGVKEFEDLKPDSPTDVIEPLNPLNENFLLAEYFLPNSKTTLMTLNKPIGTRFQFFSQPGISYLNCEGDENRAVINTSCKNRLLVQVGKSNKLFFKGPLDIKIVKSRNPLTYEYQADLFYKVSYKNSEGAVNEYWVRSRDVRELTKEEKDKEEVVFDDPFHLVDKQDNSQETQNANANPNLNIEDASSRPNKVELGNEFDLLLRELEASTKPYCEDSRTDRPEVRSIKKSMPVYPIRFKQDQIREAYKTAEEAKSRILSYWSQRDPLNTGSNLPSYNKRRLTVDQIIAVEVLARTILGEIESCYSELRAMALAKTILNRAVNEKKTENHNPRRFAFTKDDPHGKKLQLKGVSLNKILPTIVFANRPRSKHKNSLGWQFDPWNPEDPNIKKVICPPMYSENWQNAVKVALMAILRTPFFWALTNNIKDYYYTNGVPIRGLKNIPTKQTTINEKPVQQYGCLVLKKDPVMPGDGQYASNKSFIENILYVFNQSYLLKGVDGSL